MIHLSLISTFGWTIITLRTCRRLSHRKHRIINHLHRKGSISTWLKLFGQIPASDRYLRLSKRLSWSKNVEVSMKRRWNNKIFQILLSSKWALQQDNRQYMKHIKMMKKKILILNKEVWWKKLKIIKFKPNQLSKIKLPLQEKEIKTTPCQVAPLTSNKLKFHPFWKFCKNQQNKWMTNYSKTNWDIRKKLMKPKEKGLLQKRNRKNTPKLQNLPTEKIQALMKSLQN